MAFDWRNPLASLFGGQNANPQAGASHEPSQQPVQPVVPVVPSANQGGQAGQDASMDALFGGYGDLEVSTGGRVDSPEVTGRGSFGRDQGVDWTTDDNPLTDQRTAADYNIQTMIDPVTGQTIITSDNIRMQVTPMSPEELEKMGLPSDPEELNAVIAEWRERRNADDQLAYNMTSEQILEQSKQGDPGERYFDSEQHLVWAQAASARTGGQIPPEFFLEFDPYGGTAGNGPNVLPGGGAGQPLSTIAMGHDADWDLGRYMGIGPMAGLHDLNPTDKTHMDMMGAVGLFDSQNPLGGFRMPELHWPGQPDSPQHQAAVAEDARIAAVRDSVPFYSNGIFNNQQNSDWNVQYTTDYIVQNTTNGGERIFPQENIYNK